METRPSYYDSYKISHSKEHKRYRIYSKTECGTGKGCGCELGKKSEIRLNEFLRNLKTVFFVHDALLVSYDSILVWVRIYTSQPTVNNTGLYREDRTPAHPTSISRADSIMDTKIPCLLDNIEQIERIEYQVGEYIPYVITLCYV
jgi:hypothetical protein